jgi:formyltetrahydrofolate synthetase
MFKEQVQPAAAGFVRPCTRQVMTMLGKPTLAAVTRINV